MTEQQPRKRIDAAILIASLRRGARIHERVAARATDPEVAEGNRCCASTLLVMAECAEAGYYDVEEEDSNQT